MGTKMTDNRECVDCLRFGDCDWVAYLYGFDYFFWVTEEMMEKILNRGFAFICPYYTLDEADL